jgi:hypothetical protein
MADPLWTELTRMGERFGPRYASRYGVCQGCGLGATLMLHLSGVTWATCGFCLTIWNVGVDVFESMPFDDSEYEYLFALAAMHDDVRRAQPSPSIGADSMSRTPPPSSLAVPPVKLPDPNDFLVRDKENIFFGDLLPDDRRSLFAETLAFLPGMEWTPRLEHELWAHLRGQMFRGKRLDQLLAAAGVNAPVLELGRFLRAILRARSTRESLVLLREEIDQTIASLDALAGVGR